jgi:transposase InsO family protein
MEPLSPRSHAERVAIFRHTVIGRLLVREFDHGELRAELEALSRERFRPPEADSTRCFAVSTLERWYYSCKKCGAEALVPKPRADKGHGRKLTAEMRELLCDIRAENRSASVPTILDTLRAEGLLPSDPKDEHAASPQTVRKLLAARGLKRVSAKVAAQDEPQEGPKMRLKWQASKPGALWHGDVCHFSILVGGVKKPVRIHGHLDDASRYVTAIEAFWTEREDDMLALFIDALRVHGPPDALYLDNGATYRGEALITVCHRIGTLLLHPKPYDPQARGKMERFWRTLREQVLVFCTGETTLEELNRRLRAFLDKYHRTPHAGLLGRAPGAVYRAHQRTDDLDEQKLHKALMVSETRRVSDDNLVRIDGIAWELDQGFLAGKRVTIVRSLLTPGTPPAVELEGKLLPLHPVDPIHNAKRQRPALRAPEPKKPARPGVAFNPVNTLLKAAKAKKGDPR